MKYAMMICVAVLAGCVSEYEQPKVYEGKDFAHIKYNQNLSKVYVTVTCDRVSANTTACVAH